MYDLIVYKTLRAAGSGGDGASLFRWTPHLDIGGEAAAHPGDGLTRSAA